MKIETAVGGPKDFLRSLGSDRRSLVAIFLIIFGLGVFWSSIAFGIRHVIPDGLTDGIVLTLVLLAATGGYILLKSRKDGLVKATVDAVFLFLSLNILLFEITLYFNPYPDPWWSRQATDWIALMGLGNMITNELVFFVSLAMFSMRLATIFQKQ